MSELPMRGHFRYLRFKTFPMTPRTLQCEMFCPLLSSSKHSGVPEDSNSPTFPSVGLHPHTWPKWGCDNYGAPLGHLSNDISDRKTFSIFNYTMKYKPRAHSLVPNKKRTWKLWIEHTNLGHISQVEFIDMSNCTNHTRRRLMHFDVKMVHKWIMNKLQLINSSWPVFGRNHHLLML
jgi:hypothetical protein